MSESGRRARASEQAAESREYVDFLEKSTGVEIGCVSTGPQRNETIVRKGSRLEKLLA